MKTAGTSTVPPKIAQGVVDTREHDEPTGFVVAGAIVKLQRIVK
jgi:hypothetical protein